MKEILIKLPLIVMLLVMSANTACGALNYPIPEDTVHAISYGTVMYGIELAVKYAETGLSSNLAGVLQNGDKYIIWFSLKRGIGFIGIDASSKSLFDVAKQVLSGGNYGNSSTVREVIKALEDAGWVSTSTVPKIVKEASKLIQQVSKAATDTLITGGKGLITIFVLPVDVLENVECFPSCTQEQ